MRHENLYLTDIVEAADDIARFLFGVEALSFQESDLLRSARISQTLRDRRGSGTFVRGTEGPDTQRCSGPRSSGSATFSYMHTLESIGMWFGKRPGRAGI